jgi:hypothetical protein
MNTTAEEEEDALKLRTEELVKTHTDLFELNHQLASVNKELATTNKRFAETNKMFAHVIEELSLAKDILLQKNQQYY